MPTMSPFFASLVNGVVSFPWSHVLSLFSPTVLPYLLWWLGWGHILAQSTLPLVQSQNPFTLVVPGDHLTRTLCICHPSPGQLDHPALVAVQDCLSCFDSILELPVACCQLCVNFSCLCCPGPGLSSLYYSARPGFLQLTIAFSFSFFCGQFLGFFLTDPQT